MKRFFIWSIEHNRWWGWWRAGYVEHLADAGIYSDDESAAIVASANRHGFNECRIPMSALEGWQPR